jgi:hypothetical protein
MTAANNAVKDMVAWTVGARPDPVRSVMERPMNDAEAYNVWDKIQPDLFRMGDKQFREAYHGFTKEQVTAAFAEPVGRVREELARMPKADVDHQYRAEQNLKSGYELAGKMATSPLASATTLAGMTRTSDPHELHKYADAGANLGGLLTGVAGMKRGANSDVAGGPAKPPAAEGEIRRNGHPGEPRGRSEAPRATQAPDQKPPTQAPDRKPPTQAPDRKPPTPEPIKEARTPQPGTYVNGGNEAKATYGESTMAFAHGERGWAFLEGPSGKGGHAWNAPGFDGVAFRTASDGTLEVRVLDNKAYAGTGNVHDASALTKNLPQNLTKLAGELSSSRAHA